MARNSRKKQISTAPSEWGKRSREGVFILIIALSAYLLLALGSYHPTDPSWSQQYAGINTHIANDGGVAGAWISDVFLFALGYLAFLLPFVAVYICWRACWQDSANRCSPVKSWANKILHSFH